MATLQITDTITQALDMIGAFLDHAPKRGVPRMARVDNAYVGLKTAVADALRTEWLGYIEDNTEGHLRDVIAFARSVGALDEMDRCLRAMAAWCHAGGRVRLWRDGRPEGMSFYFELMDKGADGQERRAFNGGVIYRGPGRPLDGSAPAFTVSLHEADKPHSWTIHT